MNMLHYNVASEEANGVVFAASTCCYGTSDMCRYVLTLLVYLGLRPSKVI